MGKKKRTPEDLAKLQIEYLAKVQDFVKAWGKTKNRLVPRYIPDRRDEKTKWFRDRRFAKLRSQIFFWQAIQTTWYLKDFTNMDEYQKRIMNLIIKIKEKGPIL